MRLAKGYDIETELDGEAMADLVGRGEIEDILSKYGLYCAGCPEGLGEDITEAARIHGLDPDQARNLISEIETELQDRKPVID
jgi:CMP-N-acetylneuraminate monooxygenase